MTDGNDTHKSGAARLRRRLEDPRILVAPGAYDGLSARLAEHFDYDAVYVGSHAAGSTMFGVPDIGFLGLSDMTEAVRRIAGATNLPIIADGESGFGNAIHIGRSVREFERAGAAAITIEDEDFGKHILPAPRLLDLDEAVAKVRSALDARLSDDTLIVARTDGLPSLGLDGAIERVAAYAEAGADLVWIVGVPVAEMARVRAEVSAPLLDTNPLAAAGTPIAELEEAGLRVAMFWGVPYHYVFRAMHDSLATLKREGSAESLLAGSADMHELDGFLGIEGLRDVARRYGVME
jgi:2-methylisocitrate lyase-like PEP mutase family enzyme